MDIQTKQIIEEGLAASNAGSRSFGALVTELSARGIENSRNAP
jgi:hypothetical protein